MDFSSEPLEHQLAQQRFDKIEERVEKNFGAADTTGALAIANKAQERLTAAIYAKATAPKTNTKDGAVARVIEAIGADVSALAVMQTCLNAIAYDNLVLKAALNIGSAICEELWVEDLRQFAARNAKELDDGTKEGKLRAKGAEQLPDRIEAAARRKHGTHTLRVKAARAIARRAGFDRARKWPNEQRLHVGMWLLNIALEALPDVFEAYEDNEGRKYLQLAEGAMDVARAACIAAVERRPFYVPTSEPPLPWTDYDKGGLTDSRVHATLVRTHHKETIAEVRKAIASGQMAPALASLNAIQATPWKINTRVLGVMRACIAQGIEVEGIPNGTDIPVIEHGDWDTMTDQERTLWKLKVAETKAANRALVGDRLSLTEDMSVAEQLADLPEFYTAYNMDWRGRVYALPHFNFQRSDRVRSLFLFAHGMEIGEEGLQWLKVHLANCGDFDKCSKRSYDDRLAWVEANMEKIEHCAGFPMSLQAREFWTKADQPFLFLAACLETTAALSHGPAYVSSLPVSWDGSCSGLQHLCAMTRASEGSLVNLTDSETPQDVYQTVAEAAAISIAADADKGEAIAKRAMTFGVNRGVVKRNVMTFAYSSKKAGMANQQDEDLMEPLRLKVLKGELGEHPFGDDARKRNKNVPSFAARYLAKMAYEAITAIVEKPAEAMGFLQSLARSVAHEGKPLTWVTPTGLPWVNRYHPPHTKRIRMWLHDRGVKVRYEPLVAVGNLKEIDKDRAANGVAPNFVHALDAAHLALTVNAGVREGMSYFALVHDSFGCHAAWAARFQGIIREQFVEMYETHDVLAEVYEGAKRDLSEHNLRRLPDVVSRGPLNIREVLNAKYAFA
jgi:DNA-directed RNA polymerase